MIRDMDRLHEHMDELRMRGLSENYVQHRRRAILRLERRTGRPALILIAHDLDAYQRALPGNAACRAAEISHLRGYYGWAVRRRHIRTDPTSILLSPKRPRRLPRPMAETDVCVAIHDAPPRLKPMLVLAAYAGLRCCELADLDRTDILDYASPPIVIIRGKGDKERAVPLSRTVLGALREYGMPQHGPLFPRRDGKPGALSAGQVSSLLNRYLRSVGVSDSAHAMRHRFATSVYAKTKDIRAVQQLLGHASPQTTAGYAAVIPDSLADAVRTLDDLG